MDANTDIATMDPEALNVEEMEEPLLQNGKPGMSIAEPVEEQSSHAAGSEHPDDTEDDRYEHVREVAGTGNGLKLDKLLIQWEKKDWLRDWRNEDNLTLYVDAVTDGYLGTFSTGSGTLVW